MQRRKNAKCPGLQDRPRSRQLYPDVRFDGRAGHVTDLTLIAKETVKLDLNVIGVVRLARRLTRRRAIVYRYDCTRCDQYHRDDQPGRLDPCPKIDLAKILVFYENTVGSAGL